MTKRIVSGIFILAALGALGVILAGALTSGEQLIVRFLTAVIVAGLGLYVISDLRLQADEDAASRNGRQGMTTMKAPPNSTAAFMAADSQSDVSFSRDSDYGIPVGSLSLSTAEPGASQDRTGILEPAGPESEPIRFQTEATAPLPAVAPATTSVVPDELTMTRNFTAQENVESLAAPQPLPMVVIDHDVATEVTQSTEAETNTVATEWEETMSFPPPVMAGLPVTVSPGDLPPIQPLPETGIGEPSPATTTGSFQYSGEINVVDDSWPRATEPLPETPEIAEEAMAMQAGLTQDLGPFSAPIAPVEHFDGPSGPSKTASLTAEHPAVATIASSLANPVESDLATHDGTLQVVPSIETVGPAAAIAETDDSLESVIDLRELDRVGREDSVDAAIRVGESEVIKTLIEQGMLSTAGPITDRDVRTMVYVAFTSTELRKLILAGGSPDLPQQQLDLGPVELFDERKHAPAPRTYYTGLLSPESAKTDMEKLMVERARANEAADVIDLPTIDEPVEPQPVYEVSGHGHAAPLNGFASHL